MSARLSGVDVTSDFADNTSHDGHVLTFRSLRRSRDVVFFAACRNASSVERVLQLVREADDRK